MATGTSDESWTASLAYLAPLVVLAIVLGARIGLGKAVDRPTHEITLIATTAGTLGASIVVATGGDAYLSGSSPTMRLLQRISPGGPTHEYRRLTRWVILFAGTIAGGVFPTLFRGVLGLPGKYIAGFPHALAAAAIWGLALFVVAVGFYLATGVLSLSDDEEIQIFAEFFVVYVVPFALVVAVSRLVWYPLFGV